MPASRFRPTTFGPTRLALALSFVAPLASAAPSAGELSAARALGKEGVKLASSGQCAKAVPKLRQAANLYAAPTLLVPLARCELTLGHLVEAEQRLKQVSELDLGPKPSDPFVAAQAEARKLLPDVSARVPHLRIEVTPPDAEVSLDGKVLEDSQLDVPLSLNPGVHQLVVRADGFKSDERNIELAEGKEESVSVTLASLRQQAAPPAPVGPRKPPAVIEDAEPFPTPLVLLGAGGLGVLVGTVLGFMAVSKKGDLENRCDESRCPVSSEATLDNARNLALGSTIFFGVGLVSAGIGGYLMLDESPKGPSVQARIAPGWAGVGGAF